MHTRPCQSRRGHLVVTRQTKHKHMKNKVYHPEKTQCKTVWQLKSLFYYFNLNSIVFYLKTEVLRAQVHYKMLYSNNCYTIKRCLLWMYWDLNSKMDGDISVQQAVIQVSASFAIQNVLTHNYPLCGATCIWWPSWINYVFNRCFTFLSLTNSLRRFSQFMKKDCRNLRWLQ